MQITADKAPSFDEVVRSTEVGYRDMDGSPTKAWMVEHRADPDLQELLALAWGKRPGEELYDLKKDPDQMVNLAQDPAYAKQREELHGRLMAELTANHDPRLDNDAFDKPPYLSTRKR
jgi:uncharacterized sulfatase